MIDPMEHNSLLPSLLELLGGKKGRKHAVFRQNGLRPKKHKLGPPVERLE